MFKRKSQFSDPVRTAMTDEVHTVPPSAGIDDLVEIFDRGWIAVVFDLDKNHLLGIITCVDLINYLCQRVD